MRRRFRRAGIAAPDQVFGLAWSGAMTAPRLKGLLENLPEGLTEIYMHPATGPYPGSAPGYQYAGGTGGPDRSAALRGLLVRQGDKSLGGFGDFSRNDINGLTGIARRILGSIAPAKGVLQTRELELP